MDRPPSARYYSPVARVDGSSNSSESEARLHVLFVTHAYPREPGDMPGSFVLRLAEALRSIGVSVDVLAPASPGVPSRDIIGGIPVRRVRYGPAASQTLAYTGTMVQQVRAGWVARLLLGSMLATLAARARLGASRKGRTVVHAHWWFPSGLAAAAARLTGGLPFVTTLHGSDVRLARDVPALRFAFRRVAAASAGVTAVSGWLAEEAAALTGSAAPEVIPMPAAVEHFHPGGDRPPSRLLFVGKLDEQKGSAHLLEALARMRIPASLDIVHGPGSDVGSARAQASRLGVADRVRFHAPLPQPELADMMRACTALVVPSVEEGLGMIAVEAQLCERPVVAFDSGGLRDVVRHEETGLLVPPRDPARLAATLDSLLGRPDLGESLGAAGRRVALQRFSPEVIASRYQAVYRSALEDGER